MCVCIHIHANTISIAISIASMMQQFCGRRTTGNTGFPLTHLTFCIFQKCSLIYCVIMKNSRFFHLSIFIPAHITCNKYLLFAHYNLNRPGAEFGYADRKTKSPLLESGTVGECHMKKGPHKINMDSWPLNLRFLPQTMKFWHGSSLDQRQ